MNKYLIVSLCIAIFFGLVSAEAAIVAEYTFDGGGVISTDTDADTTASDFATGAGFNFVVLVNTGGTTGGAGLHTGTADNLAEAITQNEYFTFTVDAVGGAKFSLTSISFDCGRWLRGAQDFYLFSNVDGFTAGDELLKMNDLAQSSGTGVADSGTTNFNFTTVGDPSVFMGLTSVEFRIYLDDRANSNNTGSSTNLDNITVNATIQPRGTVIAIQ